MTEPIYGAVCRYPSSGSPLLPPWDSRCGGLVVARLDGACHVNVPVQVAQHSPDGPEWGYCGSGPADLALNVLHAILPPGVDDAECVQLYRGRCSRIAWDLHQPLKRELIACLPTKGGEIPGPVLRLWIHKKGADLAAAADDSGPFFGVLPAWYIIDHGERVSVYRCRFCARSYALFWRKPAEEQREDANGLALHPLYCEVNEPAVVI